MADMEDQFASTSRKSFERYTLNRFPLSKDASQAVSPRDLARCVRQKSEFSFERPFAVGIDGAQSGDAFGVICVQKNEDFYDFKEYVYDEPPEDTGYYDLPQIEQVVATIYVAGKPLIAIDPNRLLLFAQDLDQSYNVPIVGVAQNNPNMCAASALIVNAVRSGQARLGGCPKLALHLENAVLLEREPHGQRLGSVGSGSSKRRIDAAIGGALGMFALATQPAPKKSFAETDGFYSLPLG